MCLYGGCSMSHNREKNQMRFNIFCQLGTFEHSIYLSNANNQFSNTTVYIYTALIKRGRWAQRNGDGLVHVQYIH